MFSFWRVTVLLLEGDEANCWDPENASYLTYVPQDSSDNTRVLFDVMDDEVINIRAGRLPEINYVEGCA